MENRIDKYLWAVRVYKTRAKATEACRKGRVMIGEMSVRPSRTIRPGDVIAVRKMPVIYSYRVIEPIQKRVGAKLVDQYVEDVTPKEELDKLNMQDDFFVKRERGSGRPTKKERRQLDRIKGVK
ncbi:MAG: RNA-binding S4 domain-containing protein [Bacteroidales bacterium]|nr:RNA-binding S4 domain-containing protein [Bacteroidales bacterium]